MDIEKIKQDAFDEALIELKAENKNDPAYLKRLEDVEKDERKRTENISRKKS